LGQSNSLVSGPLKSSQPGGYSPVEPSSSELATLDREVGTIQPKASLRAGGRDLASLTDEPQADWGKGEKVRQGRHVSNLAVYKRNLTKVADTPGSRCGLGFDAVNPCLPRSNHRGVPTMSVVTRYGRRNDQEVLDPKCESPKAFPRGTARGECSTALTYVDRFRSIIGGSPMSEMAKGEHGGAAIP
jgi:hypothetical protein